MSKIGTMETTKYELWQEPDGYSFFPESSASARALLGPDASLIWTIVAKDWNEAQTKKHAFLGWTPYKPML